MAHILFETSSASLVVVATVLTVSTRGTALCLQSVHTFFRAWNRATDVTTVISRQNGQIHMICSQFDVQRQRIHIFTKHPLQMVWSQHAVCCSYILHSFEQHIV